MGCASNKNIDNSKNEDLDSDDASGEDSNEKSDNESNNKNPKKLKKKQGKKSKQKSNKQSGNFQHEYNLYAVKNITQKIYTTNNSQEIIPNSSSDQNQPRQFWSFIDKKKQKKYPNPKDDLQIFQEHQKQMKYIRPLKRDEEFKKHSYLVEYEVYGNRDKNTKKDILKNRVANKYKKNAENNFIDPNGEGYNYYPVGKGPEDEILEKKAEMEKIKEEENKEDEAEIKKSSDQNSDDILKALEEQPKQEDQENDNDF